jgi:hypothetical protein
VLSLMAHLCDPGQTEPLSLTQLFDQLRHHPQVRPRPVVCTSWGLVMSCVVALVTRVQSYSGTQAECAWTGHSA